MLRISLKAARVNAELTQTELAEALNVSKNTICNWEDGKGEPNASQLKTLSELSGIDMNFIFVGQKSI